MSDEDDTVEEKPKGKGHVFANLVPHNHELGLRFLSAKNGEARLLLPYDKRLVGDPRTGVLHGGAITTLIDSACGAAVITKIGRMVPVATLDLRIDYLKPAEPGKDVTAYTTCFKLTTNVAFVRGIAYLDDENDPIASAAGSFMISSRGRLFASKGERGEDSKDAEGADK